MEKYKSWLTAALALQLLVAALLFWGNRSEEMADSRQPLIAGTQMVADRIVISDDDNTIVLEKKDNQWQLPEYSKLPANTTKLDTLLSKLQDIQLGWPVAKTKPSQDRFEVSDDKFQRRLQLFRGEQNLADVYIGTSPGFRKVHARRAGSNDIHAITLSTFELSINNADWLNKSLLRVSDIQHISGPDYALEQQDGTWRFSSDSDQQTTAAQQLDTEKAKQLIATLERLQVQEVSTEKPSTQGTALSIKNNNNKWTYQFISLDDKYYVSRNDIDSVFTINKTDFEAITNIRQDQLALKDMEQSSESEQTDSSS